MFYNEFTWNSWYNVCFFFAGWETEWVLFFNDNVMLYRNTYNSVWLWFFDLNCLWYHEKERAERTRMTTIYQASKFCYWPDCMYAWYLAEYCFGLPVFISCTAGIRSSISTCGFSWCRPAWISTSIPISGTCAGCSGISPSSPSHLLDRFLALPEWNIRLVFNTSPTIFL